MSIRDITRNIARKCPGAVALARALGLATKGVETRWFVLEMLGVAIGVHKGDFSQSILDIVKPRELHLIDPWKHETSVASREAWYGGQARNGQREMDKRYSDVCGKFGQPVRQGRVRIHRDTSANVLTRFPDEYFDWTYIDGNHLYEYVRLDIELSFQRPKREVSYWVMTTRPMGGGKPVSNGQWTNSPRPRDNPLRY